MVSAHCEKAIDEIKRYGTALLKFISPNDVGVTGGHQFGFYMPKSAWEVYTPVRPTKGRNAKHDVKIEWQDGRVTDSVVTWYGQGTRSEYRLTRFGREFPFLAPDAVGDLLVLIPRSPDVFSAYILDLDEDIEEIIASLGIPPFEQWAVYTDGVVQEEDTDDCLQREFQKFSAKIKTFPTGEIFSNSAREILEKCHDELRKLSVDDRLLGYVRAEYGLFRVAERQICQNEIARLFKDVDDFLKTAASIMNRRKSRAGRALENHVDFILKEAGVPHEMQPRIDGAPDVVIPNKRAYDDNSYPLDKLYVVGIKTTCKDRWRQVLNEGTRVPKKHILTLQPGISSTQLSEMQKANVTLIVPEHLHSDYPKNHPLKLLTVNEFVSTVKQNLS